jgi:hypothetical protein
MSPAARSLERGQEESSLESLKSLRLFQFRVSDLIHKADVFAEHLLTFGKLPGVKEAT